MKKKVIIFTDMKKKIVISSLFIIGMVEYCMPIKGFYLGFMDIVLRRPMALSSTLFVALVMAWHTLEQKVLQHAALWFLFLFFITLILLMRIVQDMLLHPGFMNALVSIPIAGIAISILFLGLILLKARFRTADHL